jgi:hypothetical protein
LTDPSSASPQAQKSEERYSSKEGEERYSCQGADERYSCKGAEERYSSKGAEERYSSKGAAVREPSKPRDTATTADEVMNDVLPQRRFLPLYTSSVVSDMPCEDKRFTCNSDRTMEPSLSSPRDSGSKSFSDTSDGIFKSATPGGSEFEEVFGRRDPTAA